MPDAQVLGNDLLGQFLLQLAGGGGQNGPGVSGGQLALLQQLVDGVGEGQQTQGVGYRRAGFATRWATSSWVRPYSSIRTL